MKQNVNLKRTGFILLGILVFILLAVFGAPKPDTVSAQANPSYLKSAQVAIDTAKNQRQYLFILFYNQKDDAFRAMDTAIQNFLKKTPQRIITYTALTTDNKEANIVTKYGIGQVQLPAVLVFAPNGAITGGYPQKVTEDQLKKCLVAEITMKILKTLQEQKIALVMLQNGKTKFNQESTAAANDFANDSSVKGWVDLIKIDPDDSKNKEFLDSCNLNFQKKEATLVLLVPPNKIGGIYPGKTTKAAIMQGLSACSSGSCGAGGCN
ncbi:MAG TPA: hypothetical protein VHY08_16350 [Bacillota bacterium]|nr:hypothetical protein [Bacillota bacterium]